jgi:hypothetical protein
MPNDTKRSWITRKKPEWNFLIFSANIRKLENGVAIRFTFLKLFIPGIDLDLNTGLKIITL